jgi:hypothetical protein
VGEWEFPTLLPTMGKGIKMWIFDFQNKLSRLNKNLFVDVSQKRTINHDKDSYSVAVYKRNGKRFSRTANDQVVSNDAQRYLERVNSGETEYLGGISYPEVPEYDVFNYENSTLLRKGWRTFLLQLVEKRICTLDEARKAFRCPSLGASTYDRSSYERRLAWSKEQ